MYMATFTYVLTTRLIFNKDIYIVLTMINILQLITDKTQYTYSNFSF